MRRTLLTVFLIALLLIPLAHAESHEVTYFYRNYCESCSPEEDFAETFYQLTGTKLEDCEFTAYNVVKSAGQQAYEEAKSAHSIENDTLPMVIVDGVVYSGAGEMESALVQTSLTWYETTDSTIAYLYTPACESCAEVKALLDALPESVTVQRGNQTFESEIMIISVDASADSSTAMALFEAYNVPDEQRITPSVFFGDTSLNGAEAITRDLENALSLGLAAGKGIHFEFESASEESVSAVSLLQTIGSGFTAGLNGCALSMLLLFLSLILQSDKNAGWLAVCFLGAKVICYLLIGTVLLKLMQTLNPTWLLPLARILMTALGAVLIFLNLRDAHFARRGDLGKMRNQLPSGLRGGIRRMIQKGVGQKALFLSAILLGFLVAGGEFLCAGQLYLIRILNAVSEGLQGQTIHLIAYSFSFILPSAIIAFLILRGRSQARIAAFFANHIALIKLLTACVMLVLILSSWLVG